MFVCRVCVSGEIYSLNKTHWRAKKFSSCFYRKHIFFFFLSFVIDAPFPLHRRETRDSSRGRTCDCGSRCPRRKNTRQTRSSERNPMLQMCASSTRRFFRLFLLFFQSESKKNSERCVWSHGTAQNAERSLLCTHAKKPNISMQRSTE